jgi:hypothetical protein
MAHRENWNCRTLTSVLRKNCAFSISSHGGPVEIEDSLEIVF